MSSQPKSLVQEQFGPNADAYVTSAGHRTGPDLDRVLDAAGQPAGRALDVATGGGHTALGLARRGWQVVAVDLTPAMLRAAGDHILREGAEAATVAADAERLPFADGSFAALTCRTAAHHFPDVPAFLRETRRVLRPAGRLVVQDLTGHERPELDAFLHEVETRRDPSHVRSLRLLEWHALLREAGFAVEGTHFHRPPHDWADWTGRMGMTPVAADALWRDMQAAPAHVRDYYEVAETANGRRFVTDSAIISAVAV